MLPIRQHLPTKAHASAKCCATGAWNEHFSTCQIWAKNWQVLYYFHQTLWHVRYFNLGFVWTQSFSWGVESSVVSACISVYTYGTPHILYILIYPQFTTIAFLLSVLWQWLWGLLRLTQQSIKFSFPIVRGKSSGGCSRCSRIKKMLEKMMMYCATTFP